MNHFPRICLVILLSLLTASAEQKTASLNLHVIKEVNGKLYEMRRLCSTLLIKTAVRSRRAWNSRLMRMARLKPAGFRTVNCAYNDCPGFQTYGEDFDINQPNLEITIKLQKPAGQVSIYK